MHTRDYYLILGVSPGESLESIREAYRELALRYHPDRLGPGVTALFRDIVDAWKVLSDSERRASYDRGLLHAGGRRPRTAPLLGPVDEPHGGNEPHLPERVELVPPVRVVLPGPRLLATLVQEALRTGSSGPPHTVDVEALFTPEQAARGGPFTLELPVFFPCPACGGEGVGWRLPCSGCRGYGLVGEKREVRLFLPAGSRDGDTLDFMVRGLGVLNLVPRLVVRVARARGAAS